LTVSGRFSIECPGNCGKFPIWSRLCFAARSFRNVVLIVRSQTKRPYRALAAWLRIVALVLLSSVTGCQTNSERDLIARDRRMQEDQIYALQDYIKQYQQLVCRYRSENSSLRRQLSEGTVVEPSTSERSVLPPAKTSPPASKAPQFQTPIPPGVKEPSPPPPTTPEMEIPAVPPLKSTSTGDESLHNIAGTDGETPANASAQVVLASYDQQDSTTASPNEVHLHGRVVANDGGGGPRVMVDVVPPTASGGAELFDGKVSLMLLAETANGRKRSLGRWDFSRDDVRAARHSRADETMLRFFVELPARTPVSEPTQLWVRLVPHDGGKFLAHAGIDLTHPGVFSSIVMPLPQESVAAVAPSDEIGPPASTEVIVPESPNVERAVTTAAYEETSLPSNDAATSLNQSSWSVAQPGKPANLPADATDPSGRGGWRMSSEPPPIVAESRAVASTPSAAQPPVIKSLPTRGDDAPAAAAADTPPAKRPSWSAERSGNHSTRTATIRSWSSNR
jgi:hypothetical protein